MKKLFFFISVIASFSAIKAQTPSSCSVPANLQTSYDSDIKHLALKKIFYHNSPYKDSIVIPQSYQDTIGEGLAAIYNLTSIVERDSVFNNYCIHHEQSNYLLHRIYVGVDISYGWTSSWQSLNTTTGIAALDNLLSTYGFTVTSFSTFGGNYATLTTTQNINVKPLCDSLETFAGVIYSEPVYPVGFGNEIVYSKTGLDRFYDFTVGYGDCNAGCIAKHTFKFKVFDDCSVQYLGISDITDPTYSLPAPPNCYLSTGIEKGERVSVNLFPNPAKDLLHIKTQSSDYSSYIVSDLFGRSIIQGNLTQSTQIQISDLASGIYFISLSTQSGKESSIHRFIKN